MQIHSYLCKTGEASLVGVWRNANSKSEGKRDQTENAKAPILEERALGKDGAQSEELHV